MVISQPAYLILLALLAMERGFELFLSRRNARRAFAHGAFEVGREHYRAMVVMHTAFLASCAAESIFLPHKIPPTLSSIALSFALLAQLLRYAAIATLGKYWNTRIIVLPDAKPVTTGLYRWIRHPNYVAVMIEMIAVPSIRGCWLTAAVFTTLNALMLAIRIPDEERALGANYSQAFRSVGRFLPHLSYFARPQ
jgi:methyltransferase